MAYGSDITEGLPYNLSNPVGAVSYSGTGESYDMSFNGQAFFITASDETPYRRDTAPYRKQQVDQTTEPGEQTLTGWWVRAQTSFHSGSGINFFDPQTSDEGGHYRFHDSKGVNVWTKGSVSLLNSCSPTHLTTTAISSNLSVEQRLSSIHWGVYDGALLHDGYDVDKIYPTITAAVSNKALTSNVATLTTVAAHGMSIGMEITVAGVDATFNGAYTITTVPSTTTFTYAKTNANVTSVTTIVTKTINNKAVASNVATLTTSAAHGLTVGQSVDITGVDAVGVAALFNGTFIVLSVPTTTTFTFALTTADIASTAVSPTGTLTYNPTSVTSNVINFIDYNAGVDSPVYGICNDGTTAYWVSNRVSGSSKMTVLSKPLTGDFNTAETALYIAASGTVSNAVIEYVKERIILCADNKIYELPAVAGSLPSPIYTNPSTGYIYTSITASGPAIYVAGYNGVKSSIVKFTLGATGALPTLTSAVTAAEMPEGEIIYKISYYLGYMMIGTSKGIRAAVVNDQDGSISYGPLIVETSQPVYDFAYRDRFVWAASGVGTEPGTIRIDLGSELTSLRFAYANDVYYPGVAGHQTTSCAFIGNTNRLVFCTEAGTSTGMNYIQSATDLMSSGYIQTGRIRYSTLENKVFKFMKPRVDNSNGSLQVSSLDTTDNEYTLGSFAQGDFTPEIGISYPIGAQEYMSFKFTLNRSSSNTAKGTVFRGYQLKALPAIKKQRLIQYPALCYDSETDNYGVTVGYDGRAYDRISDLELLEDTGDTIKVEDLRTGESYTGLIEEIMFINRTPTDKRFNGFGGILLITIRML